MNGRSGGKAKVVRQWLGMALVLCAGAGLMLQPAVAQGVPETPVVQPDAANQPSSADTATGQRPAAGEPDAPPVLRAPEPPGDPVAARAYAVLDTHCARCHQNGKLKRAAPAAGFGNILRLDELAKDQTLINPGNPDGSRIFTHMLRRLMPFDVYQEQAKSEEPSGDDLLAVRQWISSLSKPATCSDREQINFDTVAKSLSKAAEKAGWDAGRQRFVSIAHLHNACAGPTQMYAARQGLVQMFNSLSWKPDPVKLEPIDDARTIYRVDLADLGWVAAHWDRIMQAGPLPAGRLSPVSADLQDAFKATVPIARADWLARYVLRAPLYFDLLALPALGSEVQRILQIDADAARRANATQRLSIRPSEFSRSGRVIERTASAKIVHWSAYDAIAREGYRDPTETPAGAWPPQHDTAFGHFSLPNGFPAFYLQNQRGQRVDRTPIELPLRSMLSRGAVRAGGDCLACHATGPALAAGEMQASSPAAGAAMGDRTTARAAHLRAGLNPEFSLDGVSPVTFLIREYEKAVSLERLAAELMLPAEALGLLADDPKVGVLIRRIAAGPVPRVEIEEALPKLMEAVGAPVSGVAPSTGTRDGEAFDTAPALQVLSERSSYKSGDALALTVSTSADCHLTLVSVDQRGRGTVIFPSDFEQATLLATGRTLKLPGEGAPYVFRLREKGRESIVAICNPSGGAVDGIKHDFERQRFTDLGNYGDFLAQAFALDQQERRKATRATSPPEPRVRGKKGGRDRPEPPEQRSRPEAIARTSITIEVR